jgi:trk system potassium uptake protein TrkH
MQLINLKTILKVLGIILFIEAIFLIPCVITAWIYSEPSAPFYYTIALCTGTGLLFYIISGKTSVSSIGTRDGFLIVTISWFLLSATGGLPYIFSNTADTFSDAFFESVSGFTTTGASVIADVEVLPHSVLFWRSLTHWMGGLGIIVLVIIILPSLGVAGHQLISLESSIKEKIHPRSKSVGYRLMYIYVALTAAEVLALCFGEFNLFDSICHSFGTVATGGFSTKNASITSFSAYSQYIIAIFMLLSGVSYVVYYNIIKFNFRKVKRNEELWFYIATIVLSTAAVTAILFSKTSRVFEESFREGFFQSVSIITTTGFISADYLYWPVPAILIIFLLLFAGGSTGSSTGSIKMARHLVMIKNIKSAFVKMTHRGAVSQIKLNDKVVPNNINISIISFILTFLFVFLAGTFILIASGIDPVTSASAVAASLGNVGPGLGAVGPMSNYGHFSSYIKVFLGILMIVGRLEIFTMLTIFTRTFWKI